MRKDARSMGRSLSVSGWPSEGTGAAGGYELLNGWPGRGLGLFHRCGLVDFRKYADQKRGREN